MDSVGTRSYMAPEQWRGQFQDSKTDQYALAVVAYEMIADRLPFEVADPLQLRECVLNEPIPALADQSEIVNQALARALSKQREERFPDCEAFIEELRQGQSNDANPDVSSVRIETSQRELGPGMSPTITSTELSSIQPPHLKPQQAKLWVSPTSSTPELLVSPFDKNQAEKAQFAWAKYLGKPVDWTNSIGMKFRLIPPGEFQMGASGSEEGARSDEKPQHQVRITKPFYMGIYPVTQQEYQKVMGGKAYFKVESSLPASSVSWDNTQEFMQELTSKESGYIHFLKSLMGREIGRKYRLPTEAEWEYACRAGTTTPFWFGTEHNGRQANCNGSYPYGTSEKGPNLGRPSPVGQYAANPFGIYDQHGQVLEWCQDWYANEYYQQFANQMAVDPAGPASGASRSLRGGSWEFSSALCRSTCRSNIDPKLRLNSAGFRAVCDLQ